MGQDAEADATRDRTTFRAAEGRGAVAVDEWPELPPLPPDPQEVEPVEEEPPWLQHWLESLDADPEHDEDAPPDHLPSEMLAALEPGLLLAAELESIDPREVDEYHLVEMIAGYQRFASWAQHRMTEVTGHLARRPLLNPRGVRPSGEYVLSVAAHELAPRLGISTFAAQRMVDNARLFETKLEDTGTALREGSIDNAKASAIARLLKDQPGDVAWQVQQLVLPDAGYQTVTQVERAVSRAIISIDPVRATARHKQARDQRRVNHPRSLPDGMAALSAVLPATDAAGLDLALEAAARTAKSAGDTRTIDQLRADALALLGHGALDRGFIGVPQGEHGTPDPGVIGAVGTGVGGSAAGEGSGAGEGSAAGGGSAPGEGSAAGGVSTSADAPVMHTGNSFLRTPHMPIGGIGGRRAQIKVTVPLSVLVRPFGDHGPVAGESSVRNEAAGPVPQSDRGSPPTGAEPSVPKSDTGSPPTGAEPSVPKSDTGSPPTGAEPPGPDDLPDDYGFPEDWYHGPPVEVAELDGYGPITPDVALALAHSGGTWQRLVTDPLTGELLDVGRTRYRPPAPIADFVRHRDGTCVRPGCTVPASSCQLDHIEPWEFGGVTSADNLGPLCTSDHATKTVGAFRLRHLGGGAFQWTTPTGHHYLRDRTGRVTPLGRRGLAADAARAQSPFGDRPAF